LGYQKLDIRYIFLILETSHLDTLSVYVSKDVRSRGYFSKPKGAREQNILRNTALEYDRKNNNKNSQADATITILLIITRSSTCFGR